MRPSVLTKLPLDRLTSSRGAAQRERELGEKGIQSLLRRSQVRFVIADVGSALRWIPELDAFAFWKDEVKAHLAEPRDAAALQQMPGEYAYFASQWSDGSTPIVLLTKVH